MNSPPEEEGLFTGLEGPDSWDNPAAWDILLLDFPEAGVPAEAGEDDSAPAAPFPEVRKQLRDAGCAAGRLCPLERCPWARQEVCVLRFGDWCPNRRAREKAARRQKEGDKTCRK